MSQDDAARLAAYRAAETKLHEALGFSDPDEIIAAIRSLEAQLVEMYDGVADDPDNDPIAVIGRAP